MTFSTTPANPWPRGRLFIGAAPLLFLVPAAHPQAASLPTPLISPTPDASPPLFLRGAASTPGFADEVVEIVNQERWNNGQLPPLKSDLLLGISSETHSFNMGDRDFFAHCDLDTMTSPFGRMTAAGYIWNYAGENIAAGYPSPAVVMAGWMGSSGHRANILSTNFREIGVGYIYHASDVANVRDDPDGNCVADNANKGPYFHYWTQNFGKRNDIYPMVINREAIATSDRYVDLYLYGADWAHEMRLSNDEINWSPWQDFSENVLSWQLGSDDGEKQVFVEIRDLTTQSSASDSIWLNALVPPIDWCPGTTPIVYQLGDLATCLQSDAIATTNDVTVESGADVRYFAPTVALGPGFAVLEGGVFHAGQGVLRP